jgi:rhodanese-related sulfurtransferase
MRQLAARIGEIPDDADKPVLLICHSQSRSSSVAHALRGRGHRNVRFVQGGMAEWMRRGWPLVKPGA